MSQREAEFGDEYAVSERGYDEDYEASSSDSSDDGNQVTMVPDKIAIKALSGDRADFVLIFPQDLPPYLRGAFAHFGETRVEVVKKNPRNLIGCIPASLTPGKFRVRVTSSDGRFLGRAFFSCWDNTPETLERLRHDPNLQRNFLGLCIQNIELLPVLHDVSTPEDAARASGYDGDNEASSSDSSDDGN